jgi:hypothetical protein
MNGANGQEESDRSPLHACAVCLEKLHRAIGFSLVERYRAFAILLRATRSRRGGVAGGALGDRAALKFPGDSDPITNRVRHMHCVD